MKLEEAMSRKEARAKKVRGKLGKVSGEEYQKHLDTNTKVHDWKKSWSSSDPSQEKWVYICSICDAQHIKDVKGRRVYK